MASWGDQQGDRHGEPRPTLFLDRDGVVIRDCDYLADPDRVELLPGVAEAMQTAREAGYQLIGVSNQSGLGRGYFTLPEFEAVMSRLRECLAEAGAGFDGFFYCPHAPGDDCDCRKPLPGLLVEAGASFCWDRSHSWVVGDKSSDVALGLQAGLGAVLVRTGYGAVEEEVVRRRWPDEERLSVADDLAAAVDMIARRGNLGLGRGDS